MTHDQLMEVILFSMARPLTVKRLAELSSLSTEDVERALPLLATRLDESGSALQLTRQGHDVELVNRPEYADIVRDLLKAEVQSELSRPSLEALAILAYRGPMTRPELEQIRGVQSSMILRNLQMRGLVEMKDDARLGQPLYAVTIDFVKFLGMQDVQQLPDYDTLHGHPVVEQMIQELQAETASSSATTQAGSEPSPDASLQV